MTNQDLHELPAGTFVSPGLYQRIDDGSNRLVQFHQPGLLPASFDGRVAVYHQLDPGAVRVSTLSGQPLVGAGASDERRSFGA